MSVTILVSEVIHDQGVGLGCLTGAILLTSSAHVPFDERERA